MKQKKNTQYKIKSPTNEDIDLAKSFWKSSLFNEVYLKNDLTLKYKKFFNTDISGIIRDFSEGFKDKCLAMQDENFTTWSETETINNWVKPIMKLLGWEDKINLTMEELSFTVSESGKNKTYRTDLLYVDNANCKKTIKEESDFEKKRLKAKNNVIMPVEAKYWDRLEQYRGGHKETNSKLVGRLKKVDDSSLSPEEQTLKYMEILEKKFGILTDGKTWKLLHSEASKNSLERSFEFDLGDLMEFYLGKTPDLIKYPIFEEAIKYFVFFFSKENLYSREGNETPVDEVLAFSEQYIAKAEENLKGRFLHAMMIACNGFDRSMVEHREEPDHELIRNISECQMFNILFIKNCEVRYVLPLDDLNYKKVSLTAIIEKLGIVNFDPSQSKEFNEMCLSRAFKGDFSYSHHGTELYERLIELAKVIHLGTKACVTVDFRIEGFRESVFSKEEWNAVRKYSLTNYEMVQILFQLGYAESQLPGRLYQQIPYNAFTPRQLGSIYESFLEFKLNIADKNYEYKKEKNNFKWIESKLSKRQFDSISSIKVTTGQLYFAPDNEERRATGSYYTPDWVVQYILEKVIGPEVIGKKSNEILNVKVCDPAMGSGHFLNGALNYITKSYLRALRDEQGDEFDMTVAKAKRIVLDRCIYGVDLNPRAVKLTKLSLWLESAHPESKLERLDDQIKFGNSLILKNKLNDAEKKIWKKAFDWSEFKTDEMIFIGNPPWGASISHEERQKISSLFDLDMENLNSFEAFMLLPNLIGARKTMFIIPRNFIRTDGYNKARKKLLETQNLLSVADFGACFKGVCQEAVTIEYSSTEYKDKGTELIPLAKFRNYAVKGRITKQEIEKDAQSRFNLLYTKDLDELVKKIELSSVPLSEYVDHYRGIEYGKTGEVTACKKCGFYNSLPKKKKKTKQCNECQTEIKLESASVYNFISKSKTHKHKAPIVVGKVIGKYSCDEFYYLEKNVKGINYKEQAFKKEDKILLMKISDSLKGFLDTNNSYATQGIYMLYLKDKYKDKISLGAILALINSQVMQFYYEYKINMGASLTTNVVFENILTLPCPSSDILIQRKYAKLNDLVDKMQFYVSTNNEAFIEKVGLEIEKIVSSIYCISDHHLIDIKKFNQDFSVKSLGEVVDEDFEDDAA